MTCTGKQTSNETSIYDLVKNIWIRKLKTRASAKARCLAKSAWTAMVGRRNAAVAWGRGGDVSNKDVIVDQKIDFNVTRISQISQMLLAVASGCRRQKIREIRVICVK